MAEGKSYKGLTGWVLDEDGLVTGTGDSVVQYGIDQAVAAQKQRAWEKAGNVGTFVTTDSIYEKRGPRCERCKAVVGVVTNGLCDGCSTAEPLVYVAVETRCEICLGTGKVLVPEGPSQLVERPLVPGPEDD